MTGPSFSASLPLAASIPTGQEHLVGIGAAAVITIYRKRSVHHVSGTTNEGKPFDATFRIKDLYRESHGKWVIVQEHISMSPHVAGGENQIKVRRAKWPLGLCTAAISGAQGWRVGCDYAHPSCSHFRSISI